MKLVRTTNKRLTAKDHQREPVYSQIFPIFAAQDCTVLKIVVDQARNALFCLKQIESGSSAGQIKLDCFDLGALGDKT